MRGFMTSVGAVVPQLAQAEAQIATKTAYRRERKPASLGICAAAMADVTWCRVAQTMDAWNQARSTLALPICKLWLA
jgi:hypothetical protein